MIVQLLAGIGLKAEEMTEVKAEWEDSAEACISVEETNSKSLDYRALCYTLSRCKEYTRRAEGKKLSLSEDIRLCRYTRLLNEAGFIIEIKEQKVSAVKLESVCSEVFSVNTTNSSDRKTGTLPECYIVNLNNGSNMLSKDSGGKTVKSAEIMYLSEEVSLQAERRGQNVVVDIFKRYAYIWEGIPDSMLLDNKEYFPRSSEVLNSLIQEKTEKPETTDRFTIHRYKNKLDKISFQEKAIIRSSQQTGSENILSNYYNNNFNCDRVRGKS